MAGTKATPPARRTARPRTAAPTSSSPIYARKALKKQLPRPIFTLLQRAGRLAQQQQAAGYVVGGFVRDLLGGLPASCRSSRPDLDLVLEGNAIAYAHALAQAKSAEVVTHPRFGTAVITFANGIRVDVATARRECYAHPAALPSVREASIREDLHRRDFTINSLAIRLDGTHFGEVVDYYGGQEDLEHRRIRVLHAASFVDDPTRIFRAVRFEQRYGFRLHQATRRLIQRAVKSRVINRLSGDRLREELILLLSEEKPGEHIRRLAELNLLQFIHADLGRRPRNVKKLLTSLRSVERVVAWHNMAPRSGRRHTSAAPISPWVIYLAVLLDTLSSRATAEMLRRLHFGRREADLLRRGRAESGRLLEKMSSNSSPPSQTARILSGLPDELLLFLLAKARTQETRRQITRFIRHDRYVKSRLSGTDLKDMGLTPGPMFRRLLERLRAARLDGKVKTEKEERALVRKLVRKEPHRP